MNMEVPSRERDDNKKPDTKVREKFWLWAVLGFLALLSIQITKFVVDNSWDPIADIITATSLADLDWSKWLSVANIVATSVIGGAAAGASAYAVKLLQININSGNFVDKRKSKQRIGDRFGNTTIYQNSTDAEELAKVKTEIEALLHKVEAANGNRRLGKSDFAQLRKLGDESLKRRARRLEAVRTGLKARLQKLEVDLSEKDAALRGAEEELKRARRDLQSEITSHKDTLSQLAVAKSTLLDSESFLDKILEFLAGPISLGRTAEQLRGELGQRRSG